jgi:diacylglycerol kinase (ATP)
VRARLIANPKSGTDRAPALLAHVNERLRTLVHDLDITLTTGEADIGRAAARAVDEGCDLLFVAGGDGTLNAALRAVAAVPGALGRITFGLIPAGTGNDFAKALGLGEEPEPAVEALLGARVIDADVGMLNDLPFINTSAGGFVADVSVTLTEEMKDSMGKLAYLVGGARALFGREPFSAELRLSGGGADAPGAPPFGGVIDLQMFAVCNARFIGGGYPIAPSALIDDGLLDVFLVKRTPLLEFVALLQAIAAGGHTTDARVLQFRAREFDLVFDRAVRVNTDGEAIVAEQCRYRVLPRAGRFLCGAHPLAAGRPRPLVV